MSETETDWNGAKFWWMQGAEVLWSNLNLESTCLNLSFLTLILWCPTLQEPQTLSSVSLRIWGGWYPIKTESGPGMPLVNPEKCRLEKERRCSCDCSCKVPPRPLYWCLFCVALVLLLWFFLINHYKCLPPPCRQGTAQYYVRQTKTCVYKIYLSNFLLIFFHAWKVHIPQTSFIRFESQGFPYYVTVGKPIIVRF